MFQIEFTPEAIEDVEQLRAFDRRQIIASIQEQLLHQPLSITRNRKKLRPNKLAEWELRIVPFRVFYDVDANHSVVKIVAVGYKQGDTLFIHGEEYKL
ncbi:MAG TPA: type II toxin-antitoxin system RelE/ParE family toxin [Roseiflexaceae bacterium]|nr:type II toxin-antitoxin system RelE/ParE family toxin [Roseiflexaceae bacterium]